MGSISHHIMPLVINSLGGGHVHAHTHAYRHSQTEAILRNQANTGHRPACTWFKMQAKDQVYWPGISSQIEDVVSNCSVCNPYRQSNTKEPMNPHNVPIRPWSQVGVNLLELNRQHYFLLIDYYSGFIKVNTLNSTKINQIIAHCKSHFTYYGILDVLITDT